MNSSANYFPFARKYRPKTLTQLVGHDFVKKIISNIIKEKKNINAFLLSGTRGVGKTTIARIFATTINCENLTFADNIASACLHCKNCVSFLSNEAVDLIEIDAASNTGVDSIRTIIEDAKSYPIRLKKKIYIIDECHMLSKSAFNALLKTLEEPMDFTIFIFATTEINKVPATILSRCLKFSLNNLSKHEIVHQIKHIQSLETSFQIDDASANLIAEIADGSMRDALSLLDQIVLTSGDKNITRSFVEESLNLSDIKIIQNLYYNCYIANIEEVEKVANEIFTSGKDIKSIIIKMLEINVIMMNILNLNKDNFSEYKDLFNKINNLNLLNMPRLIRFYDIILNSYKFTKDAPEKIIFNGLLFKLCYLSNLPTPIEAIKMLDNKEIQEFIINNPTAKIIE